MITCRLTKMLHTAHGRLPLDLSFGLETGRLLTLYGPSGAGKTTTLRLLAGLTDSGSGYIEVDGEVWLDTEKKINLPARKRSVGLVFQDFALFPHLTVREQLEFALQPGDDRRQVPELLELMELQELRNTRPALLSGGQQQRVALARAIARRPRLLLLDEPLSALDDDMRSRLQDYILKVHRLYQLTTILVSHYLPEILRLSDEIIFLERGKIRQAGTPADLFVTEKLPGGFKMTGEIVGIAAAATPPKTSIPDQLIPAADSGIHTQASAPISAAAGTVTVLCANTLIGVTVPADQAARLRPGQKVIVASDVFNPVILPIG